MFTVYDGIGGKENSHLDFIELVAKHPIQMNYVLDVNYSLRLALPFKYASPCCDCRWMDTSDDDDDDDGGEDVPCFCVAPMRMVIDPCFGLNPRLSCILELYLREHCNSILCMK